MTPLRIALEWYLNPDHLPLIAARDALRTRGGPTVELIVPDEHYDGFEALARGEVSLVVNEPLHLIEQHPVALRSLGTYFETDGGILLQRVAAERLRAGGSIVVSSPVSNPVTDGLCRDILGGWLAAQGVAFDPAQVSVQVTGFDHVGHLRAGGDAAWLAFANIEGVDVRERGLDVTLVRAADGKVPGFSALELVGRQDDSPALRAAQAAFVQALDEAITTLRADPEAARVLWYAASGNAPDAITDAMITDTLTRFTAPVQPQAARWRAIGAHLRTRGAPVVSEADYEAMFA